MPFYSYICTKCNHEEELFMTVQEDPENAFCPDCLIKMKRQLGKPTIVFKGNGWAKDGYNKPKKEESKQE